MYDVGNLNSCVSLMNPSSTELITNPKIRGKCIIDESKNYQEAKTYSKVSDYQYIMTNNQ